MINKPRHFGVSMAGVLALVLWVILEGSVFAHGDKRGKGGNPNDLGRIAQDVPNQLEAQIAHLNILQSQRAKEFVREKAAKWFSQLAKAAAYGYKHLYQLEYPFTDKTIYNVNPEVVIGALSPFFDDSDPSIFFIDDNLPSTFRTFFNSNPRSRTQIGFNPGKYKKDEQELGQKVLFTVLATIVHEAFVATDNESSEDYTHTKYLVGAFEDLISGRFESYLTDHSTIIPNLRVASKQRDFCETPMGQMFMTMQEEMIPLGSMFLVEYIYLGYESLRRSLRNHFELQCYTLPKINQQFGFKP